MKNILLLCLIAYIIFMASCNDADLSSTGVVVEKVESWGLDYSGKSHAFRYTLQPLHHSGILFLDDSAYKFKVGDTIYLDKKK